ncbi:MAG: YihY/virulence factor BrkB family protein [Chitinophagaceae bacterium]
MLSHRKGTLITNPILKGVVDKSKHTALPGFGGFSLYEVWPLFLQQLRKTSLVERAAAISFNVVMAMPPTLIFVFTLIPYFPSSKRFIKTLFGIIKDVIPGEKNNSVIIDFLNDFMSRPRTGLLSFGLLAAVFFSSNAMMGILRSFDKNYPGFKTRKGLQKRKTAIFLTLIVFALVFSCVLLLTLQGEFLRYIGIKKHTVHLIITNIRWLIIVVLVYFTVSSIYRHGPSITKKWPYLTPGSVTATALMMIATFMFSFWVNHFANYNKLYGSISAIFILMSLIYVNALAVLLGFELNVTVSNIKSSNEEENG